MSSLSVIVPIFGVEKYIERCARSLFAQTMSDIEFIFVNDCTPDSSMSILERIIGEYPNRKVIVINHERNMGLPAARKTGIEVATGEYVLHCDSDDWIEPDCCEVLYKSATMSDADIVVFKTWIDDGSRCIEDTGYEDTCLTNKESALSSVISLKSSPYVWNKLFRRVLFDNPIVYPKNNLAEDWVISTQLVYYSDKIICIDNKLHHYFMNDNSIMRMPSREACIKRCKDELANVTLICEWLKDKGLYLKYKKEIFERKIVTKEQLFPIVHDPQARKLWRRTFSEINLQLILHPGKDVRTNRRFFLLVTGLYGPYKSFRRIIQQFC